MWLVCVKIFNVGANGILSAMARAFRHLVNTDFFSASVGLISLLARLECFFPDLEILSLSHIDIVLGYTYSVQYVGESNSTQSTRSPSSSISSISTFEAFL